MTDARLARLATLGFAAVASLYGVGLVGVALVVAEGAYTWREVVPGVLISGALLVVAAIALVIARRQPRNAIGWILLAVSFIWQLDLPARAYLGWAMLDPGAAPGADYVAAVLTSSWVPGIAPIGTLLLLLFPDGRVPTAGWRHWARLCGAVIVLAWLAMLIFPGDVSQTGPAIQNPLGIEALRGREVVLFVVIGMVPVCIAGCAVALVQRYRRSQGVQRLQMKWLAAAAAIVAVAYFVTMVAGFANDVLTDTVDPPWLLIMQNVAVGTFFLIPIAIAAAILRYRLYDIDRLINRALVYGAVSALLVAVYGLGVVGAGGAMRAISGSEQGNLAVAASTLAVAALFRPFRARVQGFIDRRFYRRKYDAARTVEAFSAALRQETDLTALSEQLRDVVAETVQPSAVTLWIAAR